MIKSVFDMRTFLLVTFFAFTSIIILNCTVMSENLYGYAYYNELEASKKEIVTIIQSEGGIDTSGIEGVLNRHLSGSKNYTITPIYGTSGTSYYADVQGFEITRTVKYLGEEHEQSIVIFANKLNEIGNGYNMIQQVGAE